MYEYSARILCIPYFKKKLRKLQIIQNILFKITFKLP